MESTCHVLRSSGKKSGQIQGEFKNGPRQAYGIVRDIFNQIGTNLEEEGAIEKKDDIYYLTIDEIISFIMGSSVDDNLKATAAKRKDRLESCRAKKPSQRILLQGTPYLNFIPQDISRHSTDEAGVLKGVGCSAGEASGEAAVILDNMGAADTAGKILVAEMTDPGWVFLMIAAKGLVVEKGSLLSHTAIIGRELGIPTVVGVKGATRLIANGQTITINGHTGEVRIRN